MLSLYRHQQHSMILVPFDTPGVRRVRPLTSFGYDDAPHGHLEVHFDAVRVPVANILLGEGRGFEIAQGRYVSCVLVDKCAMLTRLRYRLGPGRIHHCMRAIGMAERAYELMCQRALQRKTFGKRLAQHGMVQVRCSRGLVQVGGFLMAAVARGTLPPRALTSTATDSWCCKPRQ